MDRISWGSSPRVRGKPPFVEVLCPPLGLIPACAGKTYLPGSTMSDSEAHPRVCGENEVTMREHIDPPGSSPRVRGKRTWSAESGVDYGLIPACAGKTWDEMPPQERSAAHPRVCGENDLFYFERNKTYGSSPRVRGKRGDPRRACGPRRLIPACAGKTVGLGWSWRKNWAHPRVYGENLWAPLDSAPSTGSSPRVRGKLPVDVDSWVLGGLIPACAGKTLRICACSWCGWAHPRVCGENVTSASTRSLSPGSSPRVRGKPPSRWPPGRWLGLIPACAGKTGRAGRGWRPRAAHPRVCGENTDPMSPRALAMGSSPRVRGKRPRRTPRTSRRRLIPACAGKTSVRVRVPWPLRAHPRVCGENEVAAGPAAHPRGSSPRVRGKLPCMIRYILSPRLIPACAGKTRDRSTG